MSKLFKNIFATLVGMHCCASAIASETKLKCSYSSKIMYPTGAVQNEKGDGLITVIERSIGEESVLSFSVGPADGVINDFRLTYIKSMDGNNVNFINLSNSTKWELSKDESCTSSCNNQVAGATLISTSQSILIDRTTGKFSISKVMDFNTGSLILQTIGNCSKVSAAKNKF